mgnify:FL=1
MDITAPAKPAQGEAKAGDGKAVNKTAAAAKPGDS